MLAFVLIQDIQASGALYISPFSCNLIFAYTFQILTPFLLRRLKTDVELSLPPKKEILVYAPLTLKQQTFYKASLDKTLPDIVGDNKVS